MPEAFTDAKRPRRHLSAGNFGNSGATVWKALRFQTQPAKQRDGAGAATPADGRPRIGLQDSCHLRNGLGVWREPRELIARVGEYVELPSAAVCCGGAGSYAIVRPKDSARVLDQHLDEIADADLDVIAVVNAGCYRQLQQGVKRRKLRTRVVHLAELLADEK